MQQGFPYHEQSAYIFTKCTLKEFFKISSVGSNTSEGIQVRKGCEFTTATDRKHYKFRENFDEKGKLNIEAKTGVTIILLSKC